MWREPRRPEKTELAIKLAKRFDGEIVSADSMQIYKGIHIASAAPDTEEMQGIPHYMLEFLKPDDSFSVAEYVEKARAYVKDIARPRQAADRGGRNGALH